MLEEMLFVDVDCLPELPTRVGLPGAVMQAEVGGSGCGETGVILAVMSAAISGE